MIVMGCDPGVSGAVAWITDGDLHSVVDMPVLDIRVGKTTRHRIDAAGLAAIVRSVCADHVIIEKIGPRPSDGVGGAFAFGEAFGTICGVVDALGIPHTFVQPQAWRRACGVSLPAGASYKDRKEASRQRALQLWPAQARLFARKLDADRAEAALLASWGVRALAMGVAA